MVNALETAAEYLWIDELVDTKVASQIAVGDRFRMHDIDANEDIRITIQEVIEAIQHICTVADEHHLFVKNVADATYAWVLNTSYAYTGVEHKIQLEAGTATVQLTKNGSNIGSAISVTTTTQDIALTTAFAEADDLRAVVTNASGATGLSIHFRHKYTGMTQ